MVEVDELSRLKASDFDCIYNSDGTCHHWDCGHPGVVLAFDSFSPECALWFCSEHWKLYEQDDIEYLTVVQDKRRKPRIKQEVKADY